MVSGLPVSLPPASCMLWFQAPQGLGCTGQEVGVQALHSHQLPVGPRSPPVRASVSPSVWWGQRGLAASDQAHRTGKQAPPPQMTVLLPPSLHTVPRCWRDTHSTGLKSGH